MSVPQVPPQSSWDPSGVDEVRTRNAAWLLAALLGAALVAVLLWDRAALHASLRSVRHLDGRWLALGLLVQALSYVAAACGHRLLLAEAGARVRLPRVLAISTASGVIASTVPVAGVQTAAAYSFRQYHRRGVGLGVTAWAYTMAWALATLSIALLVGVGAAVSGNLVAAAVGVVTSIVFLVPPVAAVLALRYPRVRAGLRSLVSAAVERCRRVSGHPKADPVGFLDAQLARMAGLRLRPGTAAAVFAFDLAFWLADVATLVCAIAATRAGVPWQGLLLAYGAGVAAGGLGLTPGGIGVVEAALAAALVAAGVASGPALAAVLAYRLLSFWLPLGVGALVMAGLARRTGDADSAAAGGEPVPDAA